MWWDDCVSIKGELCFLFESEQDPSGRYSYSEGAQQEGHFHSVMDEAPKSLKLLWVFGVLLLMLGWGSSYRVGWGLILKTDRRHLSHEMVTAWGLIYIRWRSDLDTPLLVLHSECVLRGKILLSMCVFQLNSMLKMKMKTWRNSGPKTKEVIGNTLWLSPKMVMEFYFFLTLSFTLYANILSGNKSIYLKFPSP